MIGPVGHAIAWAGGMLKCYLLTGLATNVAMILRYLRRLIDCLLLKRESLVCSLHLFEDDCVTVVDSGYALVGREC